MKKILITGGSSFIAKNLVEQLGNQYSLSAFSRKELDLLDAEMVLGCLKEGNFDVVIHTATYDAAPKHSTKDPSKVLENNLKMFFNLARGQYHFGKMIYFGSGAEFGREHWIPKMKEEYFDKHVPQDQYGFSKYIMAKHAQNAANIFNLRLFGVFGKYDDWRTRFIPNACCHAVLDMPIRIDQNRRFDFIYIDNLIGIVKWFIENNPKQKVYNVCSGQSIDFKTIAEMITKISGKKLAINIKSSEPCREYSGDNTLLLDELGEVNFSPIEVVVKKLYQWYVENKSLISKDEL